MESLGVILARAGSKGLPDKCMRALLGQPLIEYTFQHARAAERLGAVVLTTDSQPARETARRRGVEVIERPAELATDTATVDAAVRHAVEVWESRHERRVEVAVILYANVPVRATGVIDRVVELLEQSGADSVRTVAPVGKQHPDWLHRLDADRMRQFRENSIYRRQDLEPLYYHDGAVLAVTRSALFAAVETPDDAQAFLGSDRRAFLQRPDDAVDVDEALDLRVAEAVLSERDRCEPARVFIGGRAVGAGERTFVVAEAGVNHDGLLAKALQLVDAAADSGADAVKFQIFRAADLATATAPTAEYQRSDGAASQREMLARLELSDADFERVAARCAARGIQFLATPFGSADVERLMALNAPAIKLASTDLNNAPLLRRAAETGLPLIVSTGASTEAEIRRCVGDLRDRGAADRLILLHCISRYPAPLAAANLRAIGSLRNAFGLPCGLSDHTLSTATGGWAVALGACVLEKHFTLDKNAAGPDHAMSLDPGELREYVANVRAAERALGDGVIGMTDLEAEVRAVARKSIVAVAALRQGTILSAQMLTLKRPAGGIEPDQLETLIGRRLIVDLGQDATLRWDMLE